MPTLLERLPVGARVVVIRLRSLGDCVLTTPALHLLKNARPDLHIAVVAEDAFAPVFTGNSDVERVLQPSFSAVSGWDADLCLNLHGGTRSVQLTAASRAQFRAGFAHFRFLAAYNVRIPRAQEILGVERSVHTAEHVASAMFYLGVPQAEIPRARLFAISKTRQTKPCAVLHPKASAPDKTWPTERFAALARHLKTDLGLEPVFIAGPGEDLNEFAQFCCLSGSPLEEVKALLSGASLFVGNDSGPAHMAAAFGIPVMVFFGSSDAAAWSPWKTRACVLRSEGGIDSIGLDDALIQLEDLYVVKA